MLLRMRSVSGWLPFLLLVGAGCTANIASSPNEDLGASTVALDAATGATIAPAELLRRLSVT